MKKEFSNQEYAEKVKKLTPKFSSFSNCWHAFVSGGAICVLGELIRQIAYNRVGVSEENSYIVVSVCLVLISVVLTGFQLYEPLAKWCGAGTLVPITGFANSVASPAIEYQKEGQVFWNWSENFYDSRSGYFIWSIYKLGNWMCLLDIFFIVCCI